MQKRRKRDAAVTLCPSTPQRTSTPEGGDNKQTRTVNSASAGFSITASGAGSMDDPDIVDEGPDEGTSSRTTTASELPATVAIVTASDGKGVDLATGNLVRAADSNVSCKI